MSIGDNSTIVNRFLTCVGKIASFKISSLTENCLVGHWSQPLDNIFFTGRTNAGFAKCNF